MNILITGATGFLGTNLVQRLVNENHHVYLLVRNKQKLEGVYNQIPHHRHDQINVVEGDLLDEGLGISPDTAIQLKGKIDAVYHTAAYLSFDESERDLVFNINLKGTERVLEVAKQLQVKRFIHVSTAYTLGESTEGHEKLHSIDNEFVNAYEESKCHAEHLVMSYKDDLDVIIVRPAIIIGDSSTGEADTTFGLYGILRTVQLLKKRAERKQDKQSYRLLIERDTVSNLVPVNFVIDILALSLTSGEPGTIYHATNPNPPTNGEIFKAIKHGIGFHQVEIVSYEDEHLITEEEKKLNQPLEVFKQYLNRSITFDRTNTKKLLSEVNQEDLNMDEQVLLRIIQGFMKS
ncbi:nucleoside-diphosphate-sugar epimerase [Alkalibacillus filiformis]|uniref:Nucleoside-diphosphate-sugar epimerase n=1 Tax=Alkalibacillus filiformis TaxID=200990 RepID=A0ABU0DSN8_9BACI|nr:SDR family oxidoreductase [Alkalibacillus filiformis]MDQ0351468.1 nucleoside-diphosphate-sugar epimerase [Alkalibacillus filiformis]